MSSVDHYNFVATHPPLKCQGLRKSHNAAKQFFINRALTYLSKPIAECAVVDLACGRGGDLGKVKDCACYVGVDTADQALAELKRRAGEWNMTNVVVHHCDATQIPVESNSAQLVLCNFALHYFCDTAAHCAQLLDTVQRVLCPGGMWCGTYESVDADKFGVEYHAQIGDCVDATEWRVPWQRIVSMAYKRGLALTYTASFTSIEPDSQKNILGFIIQKSQAIDTTCSG